MSLLIELLVCSLLLIEILGIFLGIKEKCAELEEAWTSCADTAELLKEEVAEAVNRFPPVSTNVTIEIPHRKMIFRFSYQNHSKPP